MRSTVKRLPTVALMTALIGSVQVIGHTSTATAAEGIHFQQLLNGERLPDGDIVQATVLPGGAAPGQISIQLRLSGVTWWKGIQTGPIVLCQAQDNQQSSSAQVSVSDFNAHGLQLWKAKTFGVHTEMYNVVDATEKMSGGNAYIFIWTKD
ncbi:hypothetical protein GCM10010329_61590 [Streptomyces spiroverticillatus]|uniref:Uncharacterized protein n=1 Tax=Streptomyces finlayi TaxID=67296 RepID=A0A919CEL7_9ACTN|nr:hypothetical protein [Streptomyces finlayi]GHA30095.1 hypothetical protein GCM10010329_61590 [Streptomyces spiroverticillatus]GHD15107.1 hypothetical protein GCM10010334_74860 [Streptomyces finlayi]